MRTDRQTDMTKLIVAFRNFTNTHKNEFVPRREQPHHQKDQYFRDVREMIGVFVRGSYETQITLCGRNANLY